MPDRNNRTVRVFVSSTFRDMQAERDHLVKVVFPELRNRCRQRQVEFVEIDLRWGITSEQKAEGKVLPICLSEIQRCRPYFIGLLGERYGWVPQSRDIPDSLVENQPWLRQNLEKSVTELEILHGVLNNPDMHEKSFFYFRDPSSIKKLSNKKLAILTEDDPVKARKLSDLKDRIKTSGFAPHLYGDAKDLGRKVLEDLWAAIDADYPSLSTMNEADRESAVHEGFALSRSLVYVHRPSDFEILDDYCAYGGPPLVVTGESGMGKSSLLANWVLRYRKDHPGSFVFIHFIGATGQSTDYESLIRRAINEMKRHYGFPENIPEKKGDLISAFPQWLGQAAKADNPVMVIDALNQLEDRDRALDLGWLPAEIPSGLRLIMSTTPGRSLIEVEKRQWRTVRIGPLDLSERTGLLERYLGYIGRDLEMPLKEKIVSSKQTGNPLYLKALLVELRAHGLHESLPARIGKYLRAPTVPALFDKILQRWERDYSRGMRNVVRNALSFLAVSPRGLSESEILELLGSIEEPLPGAHWSPFYMAASEFLVNRSGFLWFFHDHFRKGVEKRYIATPRKRCERILQLAEYFSEKFSRVGEAGGYRALSMEMGEKAVLLAEKTGSERLKAQACLTASGALLSCAVGVSHANVELFRRVVVLNKKGYESAIKAGNTELMAEALCRRAADETSENNEYGNISLVDQAIELYRKRGNKEGERDALRDKARMGLRFDRPEMAEEALSRADAIHKKLLKKQKATDPLWPIHALQYWGEHYAQAGKFQKALENLERARSGYGKRKYPGGVCAATGWTGIVKCYQGDREKGLELVREAMGMECYQLKSQEGVAKWLYQMGLFYQLHGELEKALETLWLAEILYEEQGHSEIRRTRERLGEIKIKIGGLYDDIRYSFNPRETEFSQYTFLWGIGPFLKYSGNPILSPDPGVPRWAANAIFNPAAWTDGKKVHMFVRAEGPVKKGSVKTVSRIGHAVSDDGYHFHLKPEPVLEPTEPYESAGCEDPRVVKINGRFIMTYTAYDGKTARLSLASTNDPDLGTWQKHGLIFTDEQLAVVGHAHTHRGWCKSGAILDRKVNGYYWMYFGDTHIWAACSRDMATWEIIPEPVLSPREGMFDEELVEPGPPPFYMTGDVLQEEEGIWLGYNAAKRIKDDKLRYAFGAALLSPYDPLRVLRRTARPLLEPSTPEELSGQVPNVVFGEGLVFFHRKWFLYYGMADNRIGVAVYR